MATEAAQKPQETDGVGAEKDGPDGGDVVDLTELSIRPAPEAEQVDGLLEVDVPQTPTRWVRPPGLVDGIRFLVLMVVGLAAPLGVLLAAIALPVSRPVQGAVLVAGWVVLGFAARGYQTNLESRRRRR